MPERADVAIVGGGVIGSAIAYFLTADPAFDGRVVVVERDPGYGDCATTRSWGGVRQQFSTPENVLMSLFGAAFFKQAADLLAVGAERPDLSFQERGYLFLASPAGLPVLEANCRLQRNLGAAVVLLRPDEIAARFAWLDLDGVAGAGHGLSGEGWIDPSALLHGLRRKARAGGAVYRHDTVVAIETAGAGSRACAWPAANGWLAARLSTPPGPRRAGWPVLRGSRSRSAPASA